MRVGKRGKKLGMFAAHGIACSGGVQSLAGKIAQGFQHRKPRAAIRQNDMLEQAFVYQRIQKRLGMRGFQNSRGAICQKAPRKNRERLKRGAFIGAQQIVAPLNGAAQGLLARR